jgi:outer membrane autotransporter protein
MKKIIFSTLATLALSASAVEVGVNSVQDKATDRTGFNIVAGDNFGPVGLEAGFTRFTKGDNNQNKYGVTASYDIFKTSFASVDVRTGVAYLNNQTGDNGFAMTVGAGVSVPVMKNLSAVLVFDHQYGQKKVDSFNGNVITGGLKYSF